MMKQLSILLISILLIALTSCKDNQLHNLILTNKVQGSEIKLTTYLYSSTTDPESRLDTVLHQSVKYGDTIKNSIHDGRYLLKIEQVSKKPCYFHFFLKDGIGANFIYDGSISTKNKRINEYNSLMITLLNYEKNYFVHQIKNVRNLQPIYDSYQDSIEVLRLSVSKEFKSLILEERLFLDYALNPIISKKFKQIKGNFFTHSKKGVTFKIHSNTDSLNKIGFYKSQSYKDYLNDICNKIKSIDNQNFFIDGKIYFLLKQLDFDLNEAPIISEFTDSSIYPINKFIENHIKTAKNKTYAANLLISLAVHYKDNQNLSLKYSKWLISDFYDCWYVKSGEAQKRIAFHSLPINSQAPEFTIQQVNGEGMKLSDFKGNYLLIDFWGTWCAPCRNEIPDLNSLYDKSQKLDLEIIGVAKDHKHVLRKFLETNEVRYNTAIATDEIIKNYGVSSYPEKFLIDRSGKLIGKNIELGDVEKLIIENEK